MSKKAFIFYELESRNLPQDHSFFYELFGKRKLSYGHSFLMN